MRILKTLILLFILAGISLMGDIFNKNNVPTDNQKRVVEKLLFAQLKDSEVRTNYKIDVEYQKDSHQLDVNETITWKNIDSNHITEIFVNLPKSRSKKRENCSDLTYLINSFKINGVNADYKFVSHNNKDFIDSSLISVALPKGIISNESIEIEVMFTIILPMVNKWNDAQFYNFENWYATVSPLIDRKFISFPTHNYIESFLEFSNFEITVKCPGEYDVALPGEWSKIIVDGLNIYTASAIGIPRFNWFLFSKMTKYSREIDVNFKKIILNIFIQNGKKNYIERYVDGASKYLESLSSFGNYPFPNLTIVDIPNFGQIENKSYPNLIAISTDLISPTKTQKFEYQLALVIAEQYFGTIINSNNIETAWLSKGLSSFVAEKLVRAHYGDLYSYFTIADYYPIYGLHFMSYAGIPLIYTISDQVIPNGGRYMGEYYNNLAYSDLSIPSYKLPSSETYHVSSVVKPQIALTTFEKIIGEKLFRSKLEEYFRKYSFKYPTVDDFNYTMMQNILQSDKDFYNELFGSDKTFDYAIRYIKKSDGNQYEIMVERVESGIIPIVVNVITKTDTLILNWDGKDKFKVFSISTNTEIISAELDSKNKNLIDLNYANNSYVVEEKYWGSVSYATRVFFWFQNALMLIGGKG